MLERVRHDGSGDGDVILIACGLVREAKLLARPGVVAVPGGGDAARLEAALEAQVAGAALVLSCGIGGALDPALKAGDIVLHLPLSPPFVPSPSTACQGRRSGQASAQRAEVEGRASIGAGGV